MREQWTQGYATTLTNAPIRIAYSSEQMISTDSVDEVKRTLNLDNIATLRLAAPFNSESVTLLWITRPSVTVDQPSQHPPIKTFQATITTGPQRHIPFDREHPSQLISVGIRIFRVSLVHIRDKTIPNVTVASFEYRFDISEEELTADNLAAAISQPTYQKTP